MKPSLEEGRYFLKDSVRKITDFSRTPQSLGYPPPPVQKPVPAEARRLSLPGPGAFPGLGEMPVGEAVCRRRSRRKYADTSLTRDELAFLLWSVQGVRRFLNPSAVLRTVPSAGCRHPLETYLFVFAVEGIPEGVYRYLPLDHELVFEFAAAGLRERLVRAVLGQGFAGRAAAVFAWSAVPARTEWRYGLASHKVIALDAGHACQNLYLAAESIGVGTCAVAAYDQDGMDRLLRLDGREEFTVYLAPVGKTGD